MDKIKKVFSPGSSKDDEVMYGTSGKGDGRVPGAVDPNTQLETDQGKKEHGVLRQIFNPQGEKYSEESYGTTAHAVDGSGAGSGSGLAGAPGASGAARQEQGSSSAIPGTAVSRLQKDDNELDRESSMSIKSGVLGPYAGEDTADEPPIGAATERSTAGGASDAHLGRNDPAGAAATAAFLGTGTGASGQSSSQRDPVTGVPSSTSNTATSPSSYQTRDTTTAAPVGSSLTSSQPTQRDNIGSSTTAAGTNPYEGRDVAAAGPVGASIYSSQGVGGDDSARAPTSTTDDSHLGRDAAIGGGALGAGALGAGALAHEHEGIHREDHGDDISGATYTARSHYIGSGDDHGSGLGTSTSSSHPISTDPDPPQIPGEHPHARDTSLAGAGTIVGGEHVASRDLAAQEDKHPAQDVAGATYTARSYPVGGAAAISTMANQSELGGHVPGEYPSESGDDPHGLPGSFPREEPTGQRSGLGTSDASSQPSTDPTEKRSTGSKIASALGFGGAGAAAGGAAGYEASKKDEKPTTTTSSTTRDNPIQTPTNSTPHATSSGQPSSSLASSQPSTQQPEHHYGRDAAVAGGAGAAGVGAYELAKDRTPHGDTYQPDSRRGAPSTDRAYGSPHEGTGTTSAAPGTAVTSDDRNYGRDAAVAGGVGATGAGAYGLGQDRFEQQPDTTRSATSGLSSGTSQAYPSDTSRGLPSSSQTDPYQSQRAEPTRQDDHHYGRDAAIAGGAGAAGVGAYELGKDRSNDGTYATYQPDTRRGDPAYGSSGVPSQSQRTEPSGLASSSQRNEPSGLTSSTQRAETSGLPSSTQPQRADPQEHHYGRDAAIAGGAGAAGVGAYEYGKDRTPHGDTYQPDTRRGDPAYESSGLTSSTQRTEPSGLASSTQRTDPQDHHYGRDAAIAGGAGAAGVGAYEYGKDRTPQGDTYQPDTRRGDPVYEHPSGLASSSQRSEPSGLASQAQRTDPQQAEHHYGRDAAIVGGTGAAGVGAYELGKDRKEDPYQADPSRGAPSSSQPSTTTTTTTQTRTTQPSTTTTQPQRTEPEHHYGRDAAVAGGTGAAGAGAYEAYEHRGDKARQDDPYSSRSGTQGAQTSTLPDRTATQTQRTEPQRQDDQHHYGRDAAVAGGVGAAGVGAYELSQRESEPRPTKEELIRATGAEPAKTESKESKSGGLFSKKDNEDKPDKHEKKHEKEEKSSKSGGLFGSKKDKDEKAEEKAAEKAEKDDKHHYGRDAAVAGGAGAAGAGAYEAYEHRGAGQDTGPASKTIGPHDSNVANVVDPRVTPEPSQMKEKEPIAAGPKAAEQEGQHHYGRDAAVAGGVGAAGAGAYGAHEHREKENQPSTHGKERQQDYIVGASGSQGGYSPHHHHGSHEQWEKDNRTAVDNQGHHKLHKKAVDEPAESKPSLMSRILHPNRTKREEEERRASQEHSRGSQEQTSRHMGTDGPIGDDNRVSGLESSGAGAGAATGSRHMGTDGAIGDDNRVSGLESSSQGATGAASGERAAPGSHPLTQSLPTDERGYITLVNEGAEPGAHHVTVTDPQ